ncbi:MAG: hypothetical protein JKX81_05335 [Arenicella sp.]|nr:hypothetical protein [Arenicella sp.]
MKVSRLITFTISSALLALTLTSQVASAQQYKKVTRFGTSESVCAGGVETPQQLQEFFAQNPAKVRELLLDSGWTGSADDLMTAVANGSMTERAYPVGTRMLWSGSKVNGAYVANPYREWAGEKSFEAFQIDLSRGCKLYHIAIPKACCNVSLISVVDDTSSACVAPVVVNPVVAPAEETVAPVAKAASLALVPFFAAFVGTETRPRFEPSWDMDNRDSSGIIGIRAGLLKELTAKTSLLGQVSYVDRQGVNGGNIYPEHNFSVDVGVEHKLSQRAFIGAGIGAWDIDDSEFSDASLYGIVGGDIGKTKLQWFLEGRFFDSDSETLDSLSNNRMFSAGIRYLIK